MNPTMHLVPMILVLSLLFLGDCKRVEKKTDKSKDERTKFIPRDNSDCEVCRVITYELEDKFGETRKLQGTIEKGYNFEDRFFAPPLDYGRSGLRFIESTERVCQGLFIRQMEYEKELNDTSRAYRFEEIYEFKGKCDHFLERYETQLENWYMEQEALLLGTERESLQDFFCRRIVLKKKSQSCLDLDVGDKETRKTKDKAKKAVENKEPEDEIIDE